MKQILIILCMLLIIVGLYITANASIVAITPAKIIKVITHDDNIFTIRVENRGHSDVYVHGCVENISQDITGSAVFLGHKDTPYSLVDLIKLEPEEFKLRAGETVKVKGIVNIPKEGICGGRYGVIFFESMPLIRSGEVSAVSRLGVVVLLTFPGKLKRDGKITHIEIIQDKPDDKVKILTTFHATGNVHVNADGIVIIRDIDGDEIDKVFIQPANVLPGCARQLQAIWNMGDIPPGTYTAVSMVRYQGISSRCMQTEFKVLTRGVIAQARGEIIEVTTPVVILNRVFDINVLFRNTGNVDLKLYGEIDMFNDRDELIDVFITEHKIPAGATQMIDIPCIVAGDTPGVYTASIRFINEDKEIASIEKSFNVLEKEIIISAEIVRFNIPTTLVHRNIIPELIVKNTGNVEVEIEGMIELKKRNRVVGQIFIEPICIKPGRSINIGKPWQGELPMGLYSATATLIYASDKMLNNETTFMIIR